MGLEDPDAVREQLVRRSMMAHPLLRGGRSLLDVGTGVGIPGLPLGLLAPARPLILLEPRRACVGLIHWLARRLPPLNHRVLNQRLQDLNVHHLPPVQVVTRAALPFRTLHECLPPNAHPILRWTRPGADGARKYPERSGWVHRRVLVEHQDRTQTFAWWGPEALFHVKQNRWRSRSPLEFSP